MMDEFQFTEIELFLFAEWARGASEGETGQVMGQWLTKYGNNFMVQPQIQNITVKGTLSL